MDAIHKLYVEASSRCNLKCKMCFRHSWIGESYGDIEPDLFAKAMEDPTVSQTETVFFGGMGEPLIHPELNAMVALASAKGKRVELITNGTLLTERRIQDLLEAGIDRIWVSIDEIHENYGKIQVGSDFELVRSNLEAFNALRAGTGVRLGMTAVIMRDNIASLRQIKEFVRACGADDLNLSHMIPNRPEDVNQSLWHMCDVAAFREVNRGKDTYHLQSLAGQDVPMFKFSSAYEKELFPDEESLREAELFSWEGVPVTRRMNNCRFVEEGHCFIRWDGDISPCMGLLHSSDTYLGEHKRRVWHYSFGNLHNESLSSIWESAEYSAFRQRVRDFNFAPCLYCNCLMLEENTQDCIGSPAPTCGGCLWGQGFAVCP